MFRGMGNASAVSQVAFLLFLWAASGATLVIVLYTLEQTVETHVGCCNLRTNGAKCQAVSFDLHAAVPSPLPARWICNRGLRA